MAEGIVYLDVDDEITSAAQRIRSAPGTKVALVVPYGSRIATSRMNFRLLSREAVVSNRRLSIVSGDAAARSLAASAGLPVFGSVAEYESSGQPGGTTGGPRSDEAVRPRDVPIARPPAPVADPPPVLLPTEQTVFDPPVRKSQRPKRPVPSATPAARPEPLPIWTGPPPGTGGVPPETSARRSSAPGDTPAGGRGRGPVLAGFAVLGLAVIVLAVGGYLFLPSATIAVTPRRDPIGPVILTVAADPNATAVDAVGGIVPAIRLDVPVEAARTFPTTGTKVKETPAAGSVTFTNYDPTASNTIPVGSVVSTEGGIRFRTLATLLVPRASFTPPSTTVPSQGSVAVQAVKPGLEGNVPANAIKVVPPGENPLFLAVANGNPTSGGTHTETPQVSKAEVDKAMTTLQDDLDAGFRDAVAAGAGAPPDTTLFPATAVLGAATPDIDPKTLIGQPIASFDLKLTATGSVIAVDPRPVATLARAQLVGLVAKDHRLVEDSVDIVVGDGAVGEDGQVTFQATARAVQVAIVDAAALRSLVVGKTAAAAQAALAPFGAASVELWPAWVSTVTGVDARLSITINDGTAASGGAGGSGASPSAGRASGPPSPSARPSATRPPASGPAGSGAVPSTAAGSTAP